MDPFTLFLYCLHFENKKAYEIRQKVGNLVSLVLLRKN